MPLRHSKIAPFTLPGHHGDTYYERYRDGLIRRHICRNGRLLQAVALVHQDESKTAPLTIWDDVRRDTRERQPDDIEKQFRAYPVVINDSLVIGGGDNPLLNGGLALAMFAIEDMLQVSRHSWEYAGLLLDYMVANGFTARKRHHWHETTKTSKDELSGMLLGLHFYAKAAQQRRDRDALKKSNAFLRQLATFLYRDDYRHSGAWLFRFPFTREFKFRLGSSYLGRGTVPAWPIETGDEFFDAVISAFLMSTAVNFWYKPKHLFADTMRLLPLVYREAVRFNLPRKFFNVAMYLHNAQLVYDNPVRSSVRKHLYGCFEPFFKFFASNDGSVGSGDGALNAYLGVVADGFRRRLGRQPIHGGMYRSVLYPHMVWARHLPFCLLPGAIAYRYAGTGLWGERFTWEHSDRRGHVLNWSPEKAANSIGATHDRLLAVGRTALYHSRPQDGFYIEGAGLGLSFVRMLAAYYRLCPAPKLSRDDAIPTLPIDGPVA